jgi:hydrogenase maturation protein HypF
MKRMQIRITGHVQGVGCRPFVYRTAVDLALTGSVQNDTAGVTMQLQGTPEKITQFLEYLNSPDKAPPLMQIASCQVSELPLDEDETSFTIHTSDSDGSPISHVTPDSAVCRDCLREMTDPGDFRYRYPFINCTNCGPRYSIVKTIPYDRPNTTMSSFQCCPKCKAQYDNPADRRFHAQPVACPECGPKIYLTDTTGRSLEKDSDTAIEKTAQLLRQGKIVAIKGIGGFHLAVDALNDDAVKCLRRRKQREHKPFAVMVSSIDIARQFASVTSIAEDLLKSPQSPIVLLPKIAPQSGKKIAPSVAPETNTLGIMLCYAPLHHLLFAHDEIDVLVMTSANISDEPLIYEDEQALEKLSNIADAFLMHDRQIYRRVDDSVIHIIDKNPAPLRRARGYVPTPILLSQSCPVDIFAAGPDLKNTFCFVKQTQFILSEHIGDLADGLVYRHYVNSVEHLRKLFEVQPEVIACDLHPGYFSTQFAKSMPAEKIILIQHHWAHIASALAEFNYTEPVIGLVADGTGFGTDGAIWGCECLIASLTEFKRVGHLKYYTLPGADKAAKEPVRPLMSLLKSITNDNSYLDEFQYLLTPIEPDKEKLRIIDNQICKNINTVQTSSLGRLFDAVAALLNLGTYNHFDAQLPMALEALASPDTEDYYDFNITPDPDGMLILDFQTMLHQIINDLKKNLSPSIIAAKFHNCIANAFLAMAVETAKTTKLKTVALSGGVFCNRYLADRLITLLKKNHFSVLFKSNVPANDGGIALGQAAIAAQLCAQNMQIEKES